MIDELFHPTILLAASLTLIEVFSEAHGSTAIIGFGVENSVCAI